MKRDWDVIREVLLEVESLSPDERNRFSYGEGEDQDSAKVAHALLLWKAGFIEGLDASSTMGSVVMCPDLTWQGHDLLDTLRSKAVWERIKKTSKDTGIELTFDTVKMLGTAAVKWVAAQAGIDLG